MFPAAVRFLRDEEEEQRAYGNAGATVADESLESFLERLEYAVRQKECVGTAINNAATKWHTVVRLLGDTDGSAVYENVCHGNGVEKILAKILLDRCVLDVTGVKGRVNATKGQNTTIIASHAHSKDCVDAFLLNSGQNK